MYKIIVPAAALVAFTFFSTSTDTAQARGVHFRAGGIHVDVGHPHRGGFHRGHARSFGYNTYYPSNRGWGWGSAHSWHDTSHWDYHPPQLVPHGNHFHVQPGHYDWHQDGHWDHHHP